MTNSTIERFLSEAPGHFFDPDGAYGYQCKDLADAYCLALFGDWIGTIRPGNGKDVFVNANPANFVKVRNDPADVGQVPPRGAIINWGWSKAVPEGHVAIVLSADPDGVTVLEQDGYVQGPAKITRHGYTLATGAVVQGWLIPRVPDDRPTQCVVEAGDSMSSIAVQFGVPVQGLINANPQVKNPNVIRPGQVLTLP